MELLTRLSILPTVLLLFACVHQDEGQAGGVRGARPRHVEKPPAAHQDTMRIGSPAAVFFYPDSGQLHAVRDVLDTMVFKGIMHDYSYLMRYALKTVRESRPGLPVIDAKNCRYLLFVSKGGQMKCIDLDKTKDLYGVYLFDGSEDPALADMPNIGTAIHFYYKDH